MSNETQNKANRVCELLPWYVNDTLTAAEIQLMADHLRHCETCADELPMLRSVQKSLKSDKVAVLAPTPNTEQFLFQLDRRNARPNVRKTMWIVGSLAAGLAMLAVALNWFNAPQSTMPVRYQTVTEPGPAAAFHYVLLVSLDQNIGASEQLNILRTLDPMSIASLETPGNYRMVVQLTARSLDELENYRKSVESISAITNVSIVAIELPVESQ